MNLIANFGNSTGGKLRSFLSSRQMSAASETQPPLHFASTTTDAEEGRGRQDHSITLQPNSQEITAADLPHRNPFLFRTNLDFPIPFRLPFFKLKPKATPSNQQDRPLPLTSLPPLPSIQHPHWDHHHIPQSSRVSTRVWSDDEVGLFADSPPYGRASPDLASVVVETHMTRETHRR